MNRGGPLEWKRRGERGEEETLSKAGGHFPIWRAAVRAAAGHSRQRPKGAFKWRASSSCFCRFCRDNKRRQHATHFFALGAWGQVGGGRSFLECLPFVVNGPLTTLTPAATNSEAAATTTVFRTGASATLQRRRQQQHHHHNTLLPTLQGQAKQCVCAGLRRRPGRRNSQWSLSLSLTPFSLSAVCAVRP